MSETTDSPTEEKKNQWILQGIVIALIPVLGPVLGYTLAYVHETAFCDVFGIPKEFIIVNWPNIIVSIGRVLGSSLVLLWIMLIPALLQRSGNKKPGPYARRCILYFVLLFALFFLAMTYSLTVLEFLSVLVFLLFFALLDFLGPFWTQRDIKGYRDKLDAQDKHDAELIDKVAFVRKVGKTGLTLIIFIVFLFSLSYMDGRNSALRQEEFLVPSTHQQSVVLRMYGDRLICAPVDIENREITRRFFFINVDNEPNLTLIPQKIGPLKVFPK